MPSPMPNILHVGETVADFPVYPNGPAHKYPCAACTAPLWMGDASRSRAIASAKGEGWDEVGEMFLCRHCAAKLPELPPTHFHGMN